MKIYDIITEDHMGTPHNKWKDTFFGRLIAPITDIPGEFIQNIKDYDKKYPEGKEKLRHAKKDNQARTELIRDRLAKRGVTSGPSQVAKRDQVRTRIAKAQ